jgi:hypothetical protein
MPRHNKDEADRADNDPSASFMKAAFGFFSTVLKSIKTDDFLRVVWGVEVLLFLILVFMILFGDVTPNQRFILALIIVLSVVVTFGVSTLRAGVGRSRTELTPAVNSVPAANGELTRPARRCLDLLIEIQAANARIVGRGESGGDPWIAMMRDTYNHVCQVRHERRLGGAPPDPYFDVVCNDPDVGTVCDRKWELGEALEEYRTQLAQLSAPPGNHTALELLVRRSVTQPDLSPKELGAAADQAIIQAKQILRTRHGPPDR